MGYSLETCRTIVAIEKATPPEILEIMKITHPDGTVSDLKRQLMCAYGCLEPFVKPECIKVAVAQIGSKNALNIEKIKQEKEFIEILKNPESYWKESTQKTDSDKESAVLGTADSSSQASNFGQTKTRSGGSQSYEEYDLENIGDKSDEETLKSILGQPRRSADAKDYSLNPTDSSLGLTANPVPQGETKEINLETIRTEEQVLALDSITISNNRVYGTMLSNSSSSTGKDIRSKKGVLQHTKSFTKAKAIKELQKLQSIDGRSKIIQEFACLFKGAFGQNLCL